MSIDPYIFYNGNCAEAFRFYQEVLGGEISIMTNADAPSGVEQMPGATPDQVMHASLRLPDALLMGSDDPTSDGGPKVGVAVAYTAPDVESARRIFDALSVGGEVQMPFEATFWSKGFGAFVDRFRVSWLIDTAGEV